MPSAARGLTAAFGQNGGQGQGAWETFTSEDGRFSVLMPGAPQPNEKTADSPNGPYTTHLFMARAEPRIYLVGWVDYAPAFNFGVQAELEANRDNLVKSLKAQLTGETKTIKLGQHPGIEFTAETEQITLRSRVYIVGRRPYQLIAVRPRGAEQSAEDVRFFDSFTLKPTG